MSKYIIVADFFANEILGGGELNNEELYKMLIENHEVTKIKSTNVTPEYLEETEGNFIVANFTELSEACKRVFEKKKKYIIYEHDHKYVHTRNPAEYPDYIAPPEEIINYDFYKNAAAVVCQSAFHESIVKKNLKLDNITNVGGNLWSLESLDLMAEFAEKEKVDKCAIMVSSNWHKGTQQAVQFCKAKGIDVDLIYPCDYKEFLERLGQNTKFIFLPKTPETLSRIVVEARMMGLNIIANHNIGATKEKWFSLKGPDLIKVMREKRHEITTKIVNIFS